MDAHISPQQKRKDAYLKAYQLNTFLTVPILMRLHDKTKNAIDKYLYVDQRYPNYQTCFEVWRVVRSCGGTMPHELNRVINQSVERSNAVSRHLKATGIEGVNHAYATKTTLEKRETRARLFKFRGQQMTLKQITELDDVHIKLITLMSRIRVQNIKPMTELSESMVVARKRGRPFKDDSN